MITNIAAALIAAAAPGAAAADPEVVELIARATEANAHLMRGDVHAYRQAIELAPDFTLMDPFGGSPTGVPRSEEHWQRIGRFFRDGRDAGFDPVQVYRSKDMIVLVANEYAHVGVGSLTPQDWFLRVTLVFRRDEGEWRLVHRHADPFAKGVSLEQAARIARGDSPD